MKEYKIITCYPYDDYKVAQALNTYAQDGWRFVAYLGEIRSFTQNETKPGYMDIDGRYLLEKDVLN